MKLIYTQMSHNEEYQNNFIAKSSVIRITPFMKLELPYGSRTYLREDSYINPGNAILVITKNTTEDIVFNGIVHVKRKVTEYGNITCRHIIFKYGTKCVISKINAASIDVTYSVNIEYAFNEHIMSIVGDAKDVTNFFPNLIIKSDCIKSNGTELMCLIINDCYHDCDHDIRGIFNTSHNYYPLIDNSGIYKKCYGNIDNIEFCHLDLGHNYDEYILGHFIIKIIDYIVENTTILIKNACK